PGAGGAGAGGLCPDTARAGGRLSILLAASAGARHSWRATGGVDRAVLPKTRGGPHPRRCQHNTRLSVEEAASMALSGDQATIVTIPVWPLRTLVWASFCAAQTTTL